MNDTSKNSISQSVLEKIKSGKVRKLPRAYFIFRVLATIFVSVVLLLTSAFVFSFMLFGFHESGEQFLLGFGWQGILVFLALFPWALFILDVALLFVLEWLLKGFKFGYRMPLLNIFVVILVANLFFGLLINATPLHLLLLQRADSNQLPILGSAYEHIFDRHEDQGVCRGIVTSVTADGFVMQHNDRDHDTDDGQFSVTPAPGASLPIVQVGDRVLVFGEPDAGSGDGIGHIAAHNAQVLSPIDSQ